MKKSLAVLAVCVVLLLSACGRDLDVGESGYSPSIHTIGGQSYVSLNDISPESGIGMDIAVDRIVLTEDGLTIDLPLDSVFIYRDGHIIGSLTLSPYVEGHTVYVPAEFYDAFLCKDAASAPSLFNGALFYKQEILSALRDRETAFHKKLLAAVEIPRSMNIETPHIDPNRIFTETKLSDYPQQLAEDLRGQGYENPQSFAYTEYMIISGTQSLAQAGLASTISVYPELKDVDPEVMTVDQFNVWQSAYHAQQYQAGLTKESKAFMEEKNISLDDLQYLDRYFYGSFMEQTDETLQEVLTEYYETLIDFLS